MRRAAAVIVAAGRGVRAGGDVPKQWQLLAGRPVIAHTLDVFARHTEIAEIVLVINRNDSDRIDQLGTEGVKLVEGGEDRAGSVRNGLAAVRGSDRVLVHDVARPLVTSATISAVIAALDATPGAAPALPVTDALWTGADGQVTGTRDRTGLYRAQTPQGFHLAPIRAAHAAHPGGAADDVEVARAHGLAVAIVPGDEDNLKITLPADFARAERILRGRDGH
ncbi:2-C-methyl-D-erythritol 4-phosphate cytidylyltransferase [Tateyamaria sp. ANG-S1]|uniref:2-C-methyl-D-erythritol 4-phosphate cytidylyltransferase n=1 Tax=Tateyamaria sp. ANG-S1 TaxID=1577905 RepID=UPI00057EC8EE|nr:2-C-methyl-D-erythritol 4-phosphate cytidylyltransferase [Tateyamaria sp. ANG-S1]KIC48701.1 2-C-methyl-D-erythritol 4-phosphate cytidylyltransferase [Tateyamaria sp. ANG-S1]